ncbi:GNAT family N-acetyltransferase [Devosia alba]|uniref:GNAT family N-acetyltransferase n=1 Tax=Devosia alba TaxID=3152360 RepID=UPI003264964F
MLLRTARLTLRRPAMTDLEAFFGITSNPTAMRYWSTLPHADLGVTEAWLARMVAREQSGGEHFVIERDGQLIGEVGAGRLPDFGFIIHPDHWGQGYATEASLAAIAHIFAVTDTTELRADVDPRNLGSLNTLAKLGFVETGRAANTFLLGEQWCDSVYLTLPRR